MKKFVIVLMTCLTLVVGFGSYWLMMYALQQKELKWVVVYLFCLVLGNTIVSTPAIVHWFKYWEEKLK